MCAHNCIPWFLMFSVSQQSSDPSAEDNSRIWSYVVVYKLRPFSQVRTSLIFVLTVDFSLTPILTSTFHSQNTETRILFPYTLFWISVFTPHVLVVLFILPILILVTVNNLTVHGVWGKRYRKTIWVDLTHETPHCLSFQSTDF